MNLTSLYYFVELAKELHFTNTAQKLYISQQNLTQHIKRLEDYYGVALFHRKPKLSLTYAGEQLYAAAVRMLAEEHELENRLSSISENKAGNLRVGIPAYRAQACLPDILPPFYEKWPNITIDLVSESSSQMEEMLFNGELDLFIGIMYQNRPKLNITPVLNDQIYLVCSDELLKQYFPSLWRNVRQNSRQSVNLSQFAEIPFLLPSPLMKIRKTIDQCFQDAGVVPKIFLNPSQRSFLSPSILIITAPFSVPRCVSPCFCRSTRTPTCFRWLWEKPSSSTVWSWPIIKTGSFRNMPMILFITQRKPSGRSPSCAPTVNRRPGSAWQTN